MKKFAKQLLSFAVILSMVFGFSVLTFAAEPNTDNQVTETHSSYAVNSYSNASSYFEGKTNELKNSDTKIGVQPERIALSSENDRVRLEITSSLIAEGETQTFLGKVFAIHGNGYYDDKLILGDLGRNGKYSIAQFRVFSDNISNLTILVEDLDTGGLTEFSSHISQELFLELMNIADSNTTVAELAESQDSGISPQAIVAQEVIELMQPSKRFLHSINRRSLQSSSTFKSTSSYSAQSASADTLRDFCASLNDSISGSITVNGIMRNVLTQTGWKMYKTSSHFYVMHGVTNSSTEQLVGITVVSLSDYHPGTTQVNASYTIIGSCTLSYNPTTHVATRLQYDTGIRLEDAIIAIELVNGTTYF